MKSPKNALEASTRSSSRERTKTMTLALSPLVGGADGRIGVSLLVRVLRQSTKMFESAFPVSKAIGAERRRPLGTEASFGRGRRCGGRKSSVDPRRRRQSVRLHWPRELLLEYFVGDARKRTRSLEILSLGESHVVSLEIFPLGGSHFSTHTEVHRGTVEAQRRRCRWRGAVFAWRSVEGRCVTRQKVGICSFGRRSSPL